MVSGVRVGGRPAAAARRAAVMVLLAGRAACLAAQAAAEASPPDAAVWPVPAVLVAAPDAAARDVDAPPARGARVPLAAPDWARRAAAGGAAAGGWVHSGWSAEGLRLTVLVPGGPDELSAVVGFRAGAAAGALPYEVRCAPVREPVTRMLAERSQPVLFNGRLGANARAGETGHVLCEEVTLRGRPPARWRTRWHPAPDVAGVRLAFFVPWDALGVSAPAAGAGLPVWLRVARRDTLLVRWGDSTRAARVRLAAGAAPPAAAQPLASGAVRQPAPLDVAAFVTGAGAVGVEFHLVDAAGRVRARAAPLGPAAFDGLLRARLGTGALGDGAYRVRVIGAGDARETAVALTGGASARLEATRAAAARRVARLDAAAPAARAPAAAGHLARARLALDLAALPPAADSARIAWAARLVDDADAVADAVAARRRPDPRREGYAHPAGFAADGAHGPVTVVPVADGPAPTATVTVHAGRARAAWRLSPHVYGTFSEPVHYDRPIYGWLDAERVRNPGFLWGHPSAEATAHAFVRAGELDSAAADAALGGRWLARRPASTDSVAAPWFAVGPPIAAGAVRFAIACDTAAGRACQRVVPGPRGGGAGVAQLLTLPAWRAARYRLHVLARGAPGDPGVARSLRALILHDGRAVDSAAFTLAAGDTTWRTAGAELTVPRRDGPRNAFVLALLTDGALEVRRASLRPADEVDGFDPDAVAQLADLRTGWVRWPGGNYASGYRWRDGVGPRDERPSTRNYSWPGLNDNAVGTDEFLRLAARARFDPLLTVNAGTGTPEEAAAWVEYVNGDSTTPMGRLRARNGRAEPYGVRHWNVGNELWGHWQLGATDPAGYAERYARFAAAMRRADPTIVLVANAHSGHSESAPGPWNDALLRGNGPALGWLDLHTYVGVPPGAGLAANDRAFLLGAVPLSYERWLGELAADVRARGLPRVRAIVGEYAAQSSTGDTAADRAAELVASAAYLHAFARAGEFVVAANATEYSPFDPRARRFGRLHARYGLFRAWAAHAGTEPLAATVATPVVQQPRRVGRDVVPIFNLPLVDAVALRDTATGAVTVSLLNRDVRRAVAVQVRVEGADAGAGLGGRAARRFVARGDATGAVEEDDVPAVGDGAYALTLAPHTATLLVVPAPDTVRTFTNPVVSTEAGDPWVVRHGGWYYFTATFHPDSGLWVWRSRTLTGLDSATKVRVWTAPPAGPLSRQIWAPELHRLGGRWYLYFTASDGVDANHRHYVLAARTDDPLGGYDPPARVDPAYERYAIDGSVLRMPGGRLYWMYCADGPENGVYIVRMLSPARVDPASPRVRLVRGTEPWEHEWIARDGSWTRGGRYWVEAPEALVRGRRVFVAYSAGHTATPHYYVGLMTLRPGGDPMDAGAWSKRRDPIVRPVDGPAGSAYTTGHNGFTTSPDGREWWIVYHGKDRAVWGGASVADDRLPRTVRAQRFTWAGDGTPVFPATAPSGVRLPRPSGEARAAARRPPTNTP